MRVSNSSFGERLVGSRRRRFRLLPIFIFFAFALFYYFSNQEIVPITGRTQLVDISREDEAMLGLQSYRQVLDQHPVVSQGPELAMVREIGDRIARVSAQEKFDWEFNLIDSTEVNAFCLPGGKVAVFAGILPVTQNVDGLAVVMGHEIAHAIARHGAERMAHGRLAQFGQLALGMASSELDPEQQRMIMGAFGLGAQFGVLLPFSREHESEADYMGLILMSRACFNPEEAPHFWDRMSRAGKGRAPAEFLSTHPSDARRIAQLNAWLPEARAERVKHCGTQPPAA